MFICYLLCCFSSGSQVIENKVPESEACSIARAFWEEFSPCLAYNKQPQSAHFLREATRLSKTGHENRLANSFVDYGLAAGIPLKFVDVGRKESHPILSIPDIVQTLDRQGKLDILLQGNGKDQFNNFWQKWRLLQPKHPIFRSDVHKGQEGNCVPIMAHTDEGTTLKKKAVMVIQLQPLLGQGTRKRKSSLEEPGVNLLGHSFTNRVLWSVMLARMYSGKHKNTLNKLIAHLSAELSEAFHKGFKLANGERIFLVPICLKGDWPALAKVGGLSRHFGRQVTKEGACGVGICHLCQADRPGFENWHDLSWENMQRMRDRCPLPWVTEPHLVASIPLPNKYKPDWFRIDIFHTLHKGFMGDIAANAIVLWLIFFCKGFIDLFPKICLQKYSILYMWLILWLISYYGWS